MAGLQPEAPPPPPPSPQALAAGVWTACSGDLDQAVDLLHQAAEVLRG